MGNKKISQKYYLLRVFGCQMNESDGERIGAVLQKAGYSPTLDEKQADVIIAVACSVRQTATDRVYGLVHRWQRLKSIKQETRNKKLETIRQRRIHLGRRNYDIKRRKPTLILTGCVLEFDRKRLMEKFDAILPIEKLVTGHWPLVTRDESQKNKKVMPAGKKARKQESKCEYLNLMPEHHSKFQAYVPIMTGCESFCTYCVVPYVRGRETFRPKKEIICEVQKLIKDEYKEITLLGENINNYPGFPALLATIAEIPGDFWIRFLTSNPENFSDELIETITNEPKICNYIHLPFQAGSDAILKKMNRKYTKNEYLALIKKIRKAIPDAAISTDVIVGFPSETKAQFIETADLMREVKFDMAYIAQYSPRPGTAAARMADNVTREEKKWREKVLTEILRETALENNRRLLGKTVIVLVCDEVNKVNKIVNKRVNNLLIGKTEGFKNVRFEGRSDLVGKFVKVKTTEASAWGLEGELVNKIVNKVNK